MIRFYYVIARRLGSIMRYVPRMRRYAKHPEQYSEEDCHDLCREMIAKVADTAKVTTSYYGLENLPKDGGYIMYSNHQGKYDALGIMWGHPRPCRVLMDLKRSHMPIANEYMDLVRGKRIDGDNIRQQVRCIKEMAAEVSDGHVYLIFPEGGYAKYQTNCMGPFRNGCFRSALMAKCPIVPVALIDSYKPFGEPGLDPVHTQVHFLPPISYEEYGHKSPAELADMVQMRIAVYMEQLLGESVLADEEELASRIPAYASMHRERAS